MEKRKKGETAQRIYKLLHRNPGLTTTEIAQQMPDLEAGTVQVAVSRMRQRGELERRAKKLEVGPTGKMTPHYTYHVKYNSRPQPQPQLRLKKTPAPKPVVATKPVPKYETGTITTVMPHVSKAFEDAYQRLAILHTETMAELVEEKKKVHLCNSWWCRMKRWFA